MRQRRQPAPGAGGGAVARSVDTGGDRRPQGADSVRELLVESLLLATLAGAAGWALSLASLELISSSLPDLPYWIHFTVDAGVLAFSAAVALATALLCGLVPALETSRLAIAGRLAETGRGGGNTVRELSLVLDGLPGGATGPDPGAPDRAAD